MHSLAADFTLLDVWRIPIDAVPPRDRFEDFVRVLLENGIRTDSRIANGLFRVRFALGRAFGWDDGPPAPIPGCNETSVSARLTEEDRARSRPIAPSAQPVPIALIYRFEDEALVEISNRTIHALLHLGWVDAETPGHKTVELVVYVKSRGRMSDAYMALIGPFRHRFVYPPWLGQLARRFTERERS